PSPIRTGDAQGGAIFAQEAATIVRDSTITNNRAVGGSGNVGTNRTGHVGAGIGGGIDSEFDGQSDGFGPATLTVLNSVVAHHQAIGGDGDTGAAGAPVDGARVGGGVADGRGAATGTLASDPADKHP